MRPSILARISTSAFVLFSFTSAESFYLPVYQDIAGFSPDCVEAYSPFINACPSSPPGFGDEPTEPCSADCLTELEIVQAAIQNACQDTPNSDPRSIIGQMQQGTGPEAICDASKAPLWNYAQSYTAGSTETATMPSYSRPTSSAATVTATPAPKDPAEAKEMTVKIVGGSLGGAVGCVAIAAMAIFVLRRKRKRAKATAKETMQAVMPASDDDETGRRMLDGMPVWQELNDVQLPAESKEALTKPATLQKEPKGQHELDGIATSKVELDGGSGDEFVHEMAG